MPDNRRVGSPKNNPGRMEPRSVPVQKDQARINDERKVRPHSAGNPTMGIRPKGGAQKAPVPPSDKLAGEYIQARDVSMKTMTEAELAEWNPFERFMKPAAAPAQNNGLDRKVDRLERQVDVLQKQLWQMGRDNIRPPAGSSNPSPSAGPSPAAPGGNSFRKQFGDIAGSAAPSPGPSRRPTPASPSGTPWGHRGEPMQNPRRDFWGVRGGSMEEPTGPKAAPKPMGAPSAPEVKKEPVNIPNASFNVGPHQIEMMYKNAPEYFPPGSLDRLSPYQLSQVWNAFTSNKPTKGMMKNYHAHQAKISGENGGMAEGYPDTSFERCEPAHPSRVGDLSRKGKGKLSNPPGLNRGFMQARDLRIEKVTETANSDIDAMITRMVNRLGLDEAIIDEPELDQFEGYTGRVMRGPQGAAPIAETKIPRTRARWV